MRNVLFISHANPDDNDFACWISAMLVRCGYVVWCDLTNMLGGEDPWTTPEQVIRDQAAKVLFVLSRSSNAKPGPLKELQIAEDVAHDRNLTNFIVPLHLDDLPRREVNIRIVDALAVPFNNGWSEGLHQLLQVLERDSVPMSDEANPEAVASWWRSQYEANEEVVTEPEDCTSNWFPVVRIPEHFYMHQIGLVRPPGRIEIEEDRFRYPVKSWAGNLISFGTAEDIADGLRPHYVVKSSIQYRTMHLLEDEVNEVFVDRSSARRIFSELLRKAWEAMVKERGLRIHNLSGGKVSFYFAQGDVLDDRLTYEVIGGKQRYRACTGIRNLRRLDGTTTTRYWHIAFQAVPMNQPDPAFIIKTHVLFSDDGKTIWDDSRKAHVARRRQCANWWNDRWRDILRAGASWLANSSGEILLEVGSGSSISVNSTSIRFLSPVSLAVVAVSETSIDPCQNEDDDEEDEAAALDNDDEVEGYA